MCLLRVTLFHMLMCGEVLPSKMRAQVVQLLAGPLSSHRKPVLKWISSNLSVNRVTPLECRSRLAHYRLHPPPVIATSRWAGIIVLLHEATTGDRPWDPGNLWLEVLINLALGRFPKGQWIINGYSLGDKEMVNLKKSIQNRLYKDLESDTYLTDVLFYWAD